MQIDFIDVISMEILSRSSGFARGLPVLAGQRREARAWNQRRAAGSLHPGQHHPLGRHQGTAGEGNDVRQAGEVRGGANGEGREWYGIY